jgi:molybdopterin converting factor small subunit
MRVRVLLFGAVREAVGAKELEVRLEEGAGVSAQRARLAGQHAVFAD